MRLFFAINLPQQLKLAIDHWRQQAFCIEQYPVPAENLHITLAFVGEKNNQQLEQLVDVAAGVKGSRFELTLDELGFFIKPRILWLGPSHRPPALDSLAATLQNSLTGAGFALERRAFVPHVTLWRKLPPKLAAGPALLTPDFTLFVDSFSLFESTRHNGTVRYHTLEEWPLAPAART